MCSAIPLKILFLRVALAKAANSFEACVVGSSRSSGWAARNIRDSVEFGDLIHSINNTAEIQHWKPANSLQKKGRRFHRLPEWAELVSAQTK
jgi:hypothetical protein